MGGVLEVGVCCEVWPVEGGRRVIVECTAVRWLLLASAGSREVGRRRCYANCALSCEWRIGE